MISLLYDIFLLLLAILPRLCVFEIADTLSRNSKQNTVYITQLITSMDLSYSTLLYHILLHSIYLSLSIFLFFLSIGFNFFFFLFLSICFNFFFFLSLSICFNFSLFLSVSSFLFSSLYFYLSLSLQRSTDLRPCGRASES